MARILVHAAAASAGGGVTYLRQFLSYLTDESAHHEWIILLADDAGLDLPHAPHVTYRVLPSRPSAMQRVWFDQATLRREIQRENIDLLLATANFGMIRPPVPQVLLNRNALYFSREHRAELRRRGDYRQLLTTLARRQIALASIRSSTLNIVPTHAFGADIQETVGDELLRFEVVPFGFDHEGFRRPCPDASFTPIREKLSNRPGVQRILLVSHYNYFRNFDTLLRAAALLRAERARRDQRPIELILTSELRPGLSFHRYDTTRSAGLLQSLNLEDATTMLGSVPHALLPRLYSEADVVVCPSYAESFGHPMVEAMACGRPVVAADRPVHREICGQAALYFSTFDAEQLAYRLAQILDDPALADSLAQKGKERSNLYQWPNHFARLVELIDETLTESDGHRNKTNSLASRTNTL